jgi:hypothetical protein
MAKQRRRLPPREKRLTPKQFEDALVRLEKSAPDIVNEKELRKRLRQTTVHRYEVALDLIKDVEDTLLRAGKVAAGTNKNDLSKEDLNFALEELDQAIVQMTHASLKFNKAGSAGGIRSILVATRENDPRTPEQRIAEILGTKPK